MRHISKEMAQRFCALAGLPASFLADVAREETFGEVAMLLPEGTVLYRTQQGAVIRYSIAGYREDQGDLRVTLARIQG